MSPIPAPMISQPPLVPPKKASLFTLPTLPIVLHLTHSPQYYVQLLRRVPPVAVPLPSQLTTRHALPIYNPHQNSILRLKSAFKNTLATLIDYFQSTHFFLLQVRTYGSCLYFTSRIQILKHIYNVKPSKTST